MTEIMSKNKIHVKPMVIPVLNQLNQFISLKNLNPQFQQIVSILYEKNPQLFEMQNPANLIAGHNKQCYFLTENQVYCLFWKFTSLRYKQCQDRKQLKKRLLNKNHEMYNPKNNIHLDKKIKNDIMEIKKAKKKMVQELENFPRNINKNNQKQDDLTFTMNLLKKKILKIEKKIFISSIIGIVEISNSQVIIILQQCYPRMQLSKNKVLQMIGEQIYLKKVQSFFIIQQQFRTNRIRKSNLLICHKCLSFIKGKSFKCRSLLHQKNCETSTASDPIIYEHQILRSKFWQQFKNKPQNRLSYYNYFKNSNDALSCNRYICHECRRTKFKLNPESYVCSFCDGTCQCYRCIRMDKVTKFVAHYLHHGGNYNQLLNEMLMKLPIKNQIGNSDKDLIYLNSLSSVMEEQAEQNSDTLRNLCSYDDKIDKYQCKRFKIQINELKKVPQSETYNLEFSTQIYYNQERLFFEVKEPQIDPTKFILQIKNPANLKEFPISRIQSNEINSSQQSSSESEQQAQKDKNFNLLESEIEPFPFFNLEITPQNSFNLFR